MPSSHLTMVINMIDATNMTTAVCRLLVGLVLVASLVVYVDATNNRIQHVWDELRSWPLVQHDSFEPIVATVSFAVWIWSWSILDRLSLQVDWAKSLSRFLVRPSGRTLQGHTEGHTVLSGVAYLVPLLMFDWAFPRRQLPRSAPTSWELISGVATAIWLYDLLFYPVHVAMHKHDRLKKHHTRHHGPRPLLSSETLRQGLLDGVLQVAVSVASVNILRLHPLTRAMYNVCITYMLTEIHCGYDMPWMLHHVVPFGVLGGPPRHEIHHYSGRHNYHQFFTYIDNLRNVGADKFAVESRPADQKVEARRRIKR